MLDDRTTTPDPHLPPFLTWTYDDNITGWGALVGESAGGDAVSAYAAPARAEDLAGLPDTYIEVRDLDMSFATRTSPTHVGSQTLPPGDGRPHPPTAVALASYFGGPVFEGASTTSLIRSSVLVISRILRRRRR
jgi:hypothetical protein